MTDTPCKKEVRLSELTLFTVSPALGCTHTRHDCVCRHQLSNNHWHAATRPSDPCPGPTSYASPKGSTVMCRLGEGEAALLVLLGADVVLEVPPDVVPAVVPDVPLLLLPEDHARPASHALAALPCAAVPASTLCRTKPSNARWAAVQLCILLTGADGAGPCCPEAYDAVVYYVLVAVKPTAMYCVPQANVPQKLLVLPRCAETSASFCDGWQSKQVAGPARSLTTTTVWLTR
jgi:hypothetical protein